MTVRPSNEAERLNRLTGTIIDASMSVHKVLGPGLLESAYQACLAHELRARGLAVSTHRDVPVHYNGITVAIGYRIDLLVEEAVIVELKAVERIHPIHKAQTLSYMKLYGCKVGLLINFNVTRLIDGVIRLVNGLE